MSNESTLKSEKYSYNSQDRDEACMRSLYDGFTFDVIKQSPTLANGMFTDSNETGDRYRYLDDDNNDGNRYFHLDEGNYRNVSSRYKGSRTSLSVNGTIAGQNADGEVSYFTTDLLGSIRTTTDGYGYVDKNYTYDAFGAIIEGDLSGRQNFGYLGKQFDKQTGLYNYGYRDYTPKVARFTTVDPIRDGENWVIYCNNDSDNHVDLWGEKIYNFNTYSVMSDYNVTINETESLIKNSGCAMTGMANILTEVLHTEQPNALVYNEYNHTGSLKNVTPVDLNVAHNFDGNTDNLNWNATASTYGMTAKRSTSAENAREMIKQAENSKNQEYVLIQAKITIDDGDVLHWVGYNTNKITKDNTTWIQIVATSASDTNRSLRNSNWMNLDGKIYLKESAIEGAVVVTKERK